ncbi:MAG: SMP-30/gluconolactonase/LRE family protein [Verrucomicrobiaceae bacterium]|nr:SMP-30/gluconolactonase/LRE family protein [Verrucomicrobiaceae bacterium]
MHTSPTPVGTHISKWGEGPVWHGGRLLYVDIEAWKIISFDPADGAERIWNVGQRVGTVVPRASGGLVWAGDHGIFSLDEITGESTLMCSPEAGIVTNRFNDGKCDPAGRFWAGTMHLGPQRTATGSLWCLHTDGRVEKKFGPVTVSNGLVWTRDKRTMYYIDTPRRNVIAFDFDNDTGAISNERVAIDCVDFAGVPDGMTIDAHDRLWIAFCHGGRVLCINPRTRAVEHGIDFPCIETTACAFGGADLGDLYVTTGLGKAGDAPPAGSLFVCRPGAQGVPCEVFGG